MECSSEPRLEIYRRGDDIREKHRRRSYTSRESLRNEISKGVYYESSVLISFRTVGKLSSPGTPLSLSFPSPYFYPPTFRWRPGFGILDASTRDAERQIPPWIYDESRAAFDKDLICARANGNRALINSEANPRAIALTISSLGGDVR